MDVQLI